MVVAEPVPLLDMVDTALLVDEEVAVPAAVCDAAAVALPVADPEDVALAAHEGVAPNANADAGTGSVMGLAVVTLPSTELHKVALFRLLTIATTVRLMRSGTASARGHTTMLPMALSSDAEKLTQGADAELRKKLVMTPSTAFGQPLKE